MPIRNLTTSEIQNIISENPRAILELYRLVTPYLKIWFTHKVADAQDREELVADTILSIVDALPSFKQTSSFSTWVIAIARHELVDYYRRRKIKTILFSAFPFLENLADMALGPQLALEEKEAKQKIYQTFNNLGEGKTVILRLRYIEGMSVTEISQKMGLSYKATESQLSRARLAFAKTYVCNRSNLQETG